MTVHDMRAAMTATDQHVTRQVNDRVAAQFGLLPSKGEAIAAFRTLARTGAAMTVGTLRGTRTSSPVARSNDSDLPARAQRPECGREDYKDAGKEK
jgi:hypothetical protein